MNEVFVRRQIRSVLWMFLSSFLSQQWQRWSIHCRSFHCPKPTTEGPTVPLKVGSFVLLYVSVLTLVVPCTTVSLYRRNYPRDSPVHYVGSLNTFWTRSEVTVRYHCVVFLKRTTFKFRFTSSDCVPVDTFTLLLIWQVSTRSTVLLPSLSFLFFLVLSIISSRKVGRVFFILSSYDDGR